MTIEEAITQAMQSGYHINGSDGVEAYYSGAKSSWSVWTRKDNDASFMGVAEETFLDPFFWHALGEALGWEGDRLPDFELNWDLIDESVHEEIAQHLLLKGIPTWLYYWHRFIDCLAAGNTPESFFESLP
jgi:hypothetical protein